MAATTIDRFMETTFMLRYQLLKAVSENTKQKPEDAYFHTIVTREIYGVLNVVYLNGNIYVIT